MRFQSNRSSCGPAALHNALASIGIHRSEEELIQLTGQTTDGTSARGLIKALKTIEPSFNPRLIKLRTDDEAVITLWWHLTEFGKPVILCVDEFDHWVVATGYLGGRICVVDSADNRLLLHYPPADLLARWKAPEGQTGYYAIVI